MRIHPEFLLQVRWRGNRRFHI